VIADFCSGNVIAKYLMLLSSGISAPAAHAQPFFSAAPTNRILASVNMLHGNMNLQEIQN
jgi:hypothetical protein